MSDRERLGSVRRYVFNFPSLTEGQAPFAERLIFAALSGSLVPSFTALINSRRFIPLFTAFGRKLAPSFCALRRRLGLPLPLITLGKGFAAPTAKTADRRRYTATEETREVRCSSSGGSLEP